MPASPTSTSTFRTSIIGTAIERQFLYWRVRLRKFPVNTQEFVVFAIADPPLVPHRRAVKSDGTDLIPYFHAVLVETHSLGKLASIFDEIVSGLR